MSAVCALLAKQATETTVPQNVIDQDLVNNHIALPADDAARNQQPVTKLTDVSTLPPSGALLDVREFALSCRVATPVGPWLCRSLHPRFRGFRVCREGSALPLPSFEGRWRLINPW
jgi:hypothetical protein